MVNFSTGMPPGASPGVENTEEWTPEQTSWTPEDQRAWRDKQVVAQGSMELLDLPPEELYKQLGYEVEPAIWRGHEIPRRIISRDGAYIADVGLRYTLIPNPVMADVGGRIAKETGAKLFQDKSHGSRLYRYYLVDDDRVGPNQELSYGFLVYNSEDGSTGAGVTAFLFRWLRDNKEIFSTKKVAALKARHTQGIRSLNMAGLLEQAKGALLTAKSLAAAQATWEDIDLSEPANRDLFQRLKYCNLPNIYKPDYLACPNNMISEAEIPPVPKGTSLWTAYNELTANLTRHPLGKDIVERTRVDNFNVVHRVLEPELGLA